MCHLGNSQRYIWRPQRNLITSGCKTYLSDIVVDAQQVDLELCSYCYVCAAGYKAFWLGTIQNIVLSLGGCGVWALIRWPCGLTITLALSEPGRPLSGNAALQQQ